MSNYSEEEDEGIHFDPDDDELIKHYLIPKLKGELACGDFIVHKNVYAKVPWLLDHSKDRFFMKDEWYYFVTRTQVSEKKIGCGKKAKRKIRGDNDGIDRGNWKADSSEPIIDKKTRKIIGTKQTLSFKKSNSNNNKKQKRGDGTCVIVPGSNSSWIMKEYTLPEGDTFQELVLCKIKIKKSKKKDDHHEASTSTYHHNHESSSSEQQPISDHDSVLASSSDQQQEPISAPAHMNVPLARLGDKSLPIELDDNSNEDEEWNCSAFLTLIRDEEDAPNMQWMDQEY